MTEGTPRLLFLCTANACRSQMGQYLARHHFPNAFVASAGVKPGSEVDPRAKLVLEELGIDTSDAYNKDLSAVQLPSPQKYDLVVTVCSKAAEECPIYSGAKTVRRPFEDPPALWKEAKLSDEHVDPLPFYRKVRDEIDMFIINDLPLLVPTLQRQVS